MGSPKVVVIGASTGGLEALKAVTHFLPADLPASVFIVMHIGAWDSILPELLQATCRLPIKHAVDGERILPSVVYVAPPDRHMLLHEGAVELSRGLKENFCRPAIDPLFRSAAVEYGPDAIGVILTGNLDDGAAGLRAIAACGGATVVQSPQSSRAPSMPLAAIRAVDVDVIVPLAQVGLAVDFAVHQSPTARQCNMNELGEPALLFKW